MVQLSRIGLRPGIGGAGRVGFVPVDFSQPRYNANATTLAAWKAVVQAAGTTVKKVGCIGDSTTTGIGAASLSLGLKAESGPVQLAALMNSASIPAEIDSYCGNGRTDGTIANYKTFDPRMTSTAAWNAGTDGTYGAGGKFFGSATASSKLTFTPGSDFDTLELYYLEPVSGRTILVDVGGATIATIGNSGFTANTPMRTTIAAGGTVSVAQITSGAATGINHLGIRTYTASAGKIGLISFGLAGTKTAEWTSTAQIYFPLAWLPKLSLDAAFINLTINDENAGTALATYSSQLQTMITALKTTGTVCLVVGAPTNNGATLVQQMVYWNKCVELAIANNIPVLNLYYYFGSWANANAQGWMFDVSHPNTAGYAVWAQAYLEFLQAAAAS